MAQFFNKIKSKIDWTNSIRRLFAGPIDSTTLYKNKEDIETYVNNNTSAWVGQPVVESCECQSKSCTTDTQCECHSHNPQDHCGIHTCQCHGNVSCPADQCNTNCGCQSQLCTSNCKANVPEHTCECNTFSEACTMDSCDVDSCSTDSCACNTHISTCTCFSELIPAQCECQTVCNIDKVSCETDICKCNTYQRGCKGHCLCNTDYTCVSDSSSCNIVELYCPCNVNTKLWQVTGKNNIEEVGVGFITKNEIKDMIWGTACPNKEVCPQYCFNCMDEICTANCSGKESCNCQGVCTSDCSCNTYQVVPCPTDTACTDCGCDYYTGCVCNDYTPSPCPVYSCTDDCGTNICSAYDPCSAHCIPHEICTCESYIEDYKPIDGNILELKINSGFISKNLDEGVSCRTDICDAETKPCDIYCGAESACTSDSYIRCETY